MAGHGRPRRRRRRQSTGQQKLLVGEKVEVRSIEDGLLGSWHPGVVLTCTCRGRLIQYEHLLCEDKSEHLSEFVEVSSAIEGTGSCSESTIHYRGRIRPSPPIIDLGMYLQYGLCVDASYNDAWWEGVVFDQEDSSDERRIFFPDLGDEVIIKMEHLRLTQDWNEATGKWAPRGNWLFLEIIRDLKPDYVFPVSIRQMWYDVREKEKFDQVKEWIFPVKPVWEELVMEVISDNLRLTLGELLNMVNPSQNLVACAFDVTLTHKPSAEPQVSNAMVVTNITGLECSVLNTDLLNDEGGFEVLVPPNDQREFEQPEALSVLPSDQEKYTGSSLSAHSEKLFCSSSMTHGTRHSGSKTRSFKQWMPAVPDIVPGPGIFPKSVSQYLYLHSEKPGPELSMNLRQHLCYLGWKIEYSKEVRMTRMRYISPEGKVYYSLRTVIQSIGQVMSVKCSSESEEIQESLSTQPYIPSSSPRLDIHRTHVPEVEPEFCPQIVKEYLEYVNKCSQTNRRVKRHDLTMKARKHLLAIGWSFRFKRKGNKLEWCYDSPDNPCKTYFSLKTALEDPKAKGLVSDCLPSSSPSQIVGCDRRGSSDDRPSSPYSEVEGIVVPLVEHPKKDFEKKHANQGSGQLNKSKKNGLLQAQHPLASGRRWSLPCDTSTDGLMNCGKHRSVTKPRLNALSGRRKVRTRSDEYYSTEVLRSSKRARHVAPSGSSHHNPLTVLSWLIDNDMVLPRAKVYYRNRKDGDALLEGRVSHDGIRCACCHNVIGLSDFQAHAMGSHRIPGAKIFLEDGRSLVDCQMQMLSKNARSFSEETPDKKGKKQVQSENDHICSVCHYGGSLILCDRCPSSFHTKCVGLPGVPEGDWFCLSCCCAICGGSQFVDNGEEAKEESGLSCHQCERQYHVSCVRGRGKAKLDKCVNGKWFCSRTCEKVYQGLQRILGKPIPVGADNLTWTLVKAMQYGDMDCAGQSYSETLAENYCKLNVALEVMHECFEPVIEPRTRRDIAEDVIFSKGSELKRLNFKGFYTVLLERNEALISVATLRVYGNKVAEVPLVGTRCHYRRLGMCRVLMNELEKMLKELGVERLVLPAVPSVFNTWTGSFGFSEMAQSEISEFLTYTTLNFQGTVMCQKPLKELSPSVPLIQKKNHHDLHQVDNASDSTIEKVNRRDISDVHREGETKGNESVDQGPVSVTESNDNSTSDGLASSKIMPTPPPHHPCSSIENNAEFTILKGDQEMMIVDGDDSELKKEIKKYTRKKQLSIPPIPRSNYPKVEVSCR